MRGRQANRQPCGVYRPLPTVASTIERRDVNENGAELLVIHRVTLDDVFIGWAVGRASETPWGRISALRWAAHAPTTVLIDPAASRLDAAGLLVVHAERAKEVAA